ncbi:MAG: hypothetical protein R2695_01950 [Acidimicrobiales bacterium]
MLVALALPRPVTLTAARLGVTATFVAAAWAAATVDEVVVRVVGVVAAAVATIIVLLPALADRFVDGGATGTSADSCSSHRGRC